MHTLRMLIRQGLFVAVSLTMIISLTPGLVNQAKAVTFSISGTAYKYSAIPANKLAGVQISARNLDPSQPGNGTTSAIDGTFTLSNLNPGTYAVEARYFPNQSDPGAPTDLIPPSLAPITITGANSTGNNIVFLQAQNVVTGTVYRANGTTPIANASVKIFSMNGGAFFSVTANSSGVYTQKVGSGDYMVKAEAEINGGADWMYPGMPKPVRFDANDGTTQTINFTTVNANVTVTGTFRTPTSGVPVAGDLFAMLEANGGFGQRIFFDGSGNFTTKVGPGTYSLKIFPNFNHPTWTAPRMNSMVISDADANTTRALGTITLSTKTDTISGTVTNSSGTAIANTQVMAFQTAESGVSEGKRMFMGGNFSQTTTNASGAYTLYVTPGQWSVRAMPQFGGGAATAYVPSSPQTVTVTSGTPATANLTMQTADATVSGDIVDTSGTALTNVYGFVSVDSSGGEFFGLGGPIQNGKFGFKIPAGTYTLHVFLPPGAGYSAGSSTTFTVASNGSAALTGSAAVRLTQNNATITGSMKDQNGTTITGKTAQVFAKDANGNFSFGTVGTNGSYSLKVAAGTWQLNFAIDASTGYVAENGLMYTVTATANQTTTQNLTAKLADSTISGSTKKSDGTAVAGAYVTVDNRTGLKKTGESFGLVLGNSTTSDSSGNWSLTVPAGTYEVRASVPLSKSLINPDAVSVTTSAASPKTGVSLFFGAADATITGTVSTTSAAAGTTAQSLAYVTAWSDKGGYTEGQTDANGAYTLNVTKGDVWHVTSVKENGQQMYKSTENAVTLGSADTTASKDITLTLSSVTMPKQASTTCSATQTCTLKLSDGATVTAPGSSLATSGNVTITATPKAQLPRHANDRPVGDYGYDFVATDDNGQAISTFNSQVSVTIPYSDSSLTASGVTSTDLAPKSWDTNTATWQSPSSTTVDTTNKTVTLGTTHFTNFAITAETSSIPTVTVSSPTTGTKQSNSTVDIVGTVNDPAAAVTIKVGTIDQGAVTVNSATGAFTKTVALDTGVNTVTVEATNVVGTGSASLTVENTLPTITRVGPKVFKVEKRKNATVKLTIIGTYFVSGAKVKVGPINATKVDVKNSTTIVATLPITKFGVGKYSVTVTNSDDGTIKADRVLTIKGKTPKAMSVSPSVLPAKSSGTRQVTISGENFSAGATILLNGKTSLTVVRVSSTKIVVKIPLNKLTKGKSVSLVIVNADDQRVTLSRRLFGK